MSNNSIVPIPGNFYDAFGKILYGKRHMMGYHQAEVASAIGVSQVYYEKIEFGLVKVSLEHALCACLVLGLSMDDVARQLVPEEDLPVLSEQAAERLLHEIASVDDSKVE